MTSQEIVDKHIGIFKSQRSEGVIAKFIILFLLIIAFIYSYYDLRATFEVKNIGEDFKEEQIVPTLAVTCLFFSVLLLFSKSIKYVYPPKLKSARRKYKKDIYNFIISEHPEITEYSPNQKINPKEFYTSKLFKTEPEDYKGDDWLTASYRGHKVVMCELRVSRLFKKIFTGLFVKCSNIKRSIPNPISFSHLYPISGERQYFSSDTIKYISNYCKKYESGICVSTVDHALYIGIERNKNLFERTSLEAIKNLPEEFEIFKSNFEIIKCIILDLN